MEQFIENSGLSWDEFLERPCGDLSSDAQFMFSKLIAELASGGDLEKALIFASGELILKQDDISKDVRASRAKDEILICLLKMFWKDFESRI